MSSPSQLASCLHTSLAMSSALICENSGQQSFMNVASKGGHNGGYSSCCCRGGGARSEAAVVVVVASIMVAAAVDKEAISCRVFSINSVARKGTLLCVVSRRLTPLSLVHHSNRRLPPQQLCPMVWITTGT